MRHISAFLLFFCISAGLAFTQDTPRGEVFGGYSYLNIDTNGLSSRQSIPIGLNFSFVANMNQSVGLETNNATYYRRIDGIDLYDYSLFFGPRFHYKWGFIHVLIGIDDLSAKHIADQASLAGAIGVGRIFKVSPRLRLEASADYIPSSHNFFGGSETIQSNFRATFGFVYSFGHVAGSTEPQAPSTSTRPSTRRIVGAGMNILSLGIMATLGRSDGAEITDVAPNGVAALAGLNIGDVINAVDGKPVKTPMELAAELANHAAGDKVRIDYMLHGEWQSEAVVVLGQGH